VIINYYVQPGLDRENCISENSVKLADRDDRVGSIPDENSAMWPRCYIGITIYRV
jgi:hypothetical protein